MARKLVKESIIRLGDGRGKDASTREKLDTRWRRYVLENMKWHTSGHQGPRYIYTYSEPVYNAIKNRDENIIFGKPGNRRNITDRVQGLIPLGIKTPTVKTQKRPYFIEQEWKGTDKFGGTKDKHPEVLNFLRYGVMDLDTFTQ